MSVLDQILPPAATLAHPLTGEVIDRDDLEAINVALTEAAQWLDAQPDRRPFYRAREALIARQGELGEPVEMPRRAYQTRYQRAVTDCPRCGTKLPQTVISEALSEGEEREPDAVGRVASPSESATVSEGERVGADTPSGDPSRDAVGTASSPSLTVEQTTLLPQGPRTAEQEAALGIDILGEKTGASTRPVVDDQPSSTTPEPPEAEDSSGGSPSLFEIPPSARSEP